MRPVRSATRGALALSIVALHLAGLTLLWLQRERPAPTPPRRAGLVIRLLPLAPRPSLRPAAPAHGERLRAPTAAEPQPRGVATPLPPALVQAPAMATAPASAPLAAMDERAASAPLDLRLPRDYARSPEYSTNPARNDVRANLPQSHLEGRIANELGGDGRWVEEPMDVNRRRLRRGNLCVNVERSRLVQNNPYNQSVAPLMAEYSPPYRCERR